jgi:hypothetical protein
LHVVGAHVKRKPQVGPEEQDMIRAQGAGDYQALSSPAAPTS